MGYAFKTVLFMPQVLTIAIHTPNTTHTATANAPALSPKYRAPRQIRAGNRPLQGTMALVRIAARRCRGEAMIRQPVTPTALQPSPMHNVNACLPQPPQRCIPRSSRNASRGRYPASSISANKGKKISSGGSITQMTRAAVV